MGWTIVHLYKHIDITNNRNLVYGLNVAAVIAFLIFLWVFGAMAGSITVKFTKSYFIWLIVALLVVVTIHEVIHGVLYKAFKPNGKIKIGFKNGLLSVSSPKSLYTKQQFLWIGATPFVAISLVLMAMFFVGWLPGDIFLALASLHGAGCVGDFYLLCLVMTSPKYYYISDREDGIDIYSNS